MSDTQNHVNDSLQAGDYFGITRGPAYGNVDGQYSRSNNGMTFQVMKVCGPLVVAKSVAATARCNQNRIGERYSFNGNDVRWQRVTKEYADAMHPESEPAPSPHPDTKRLDWLDSAHLGLSRRWQVKYYFGGGVGVLSEGKANTSPPYYATARAAIDAAMEAEPKGSDDGNDS